MDVGYHAVMDQQNALNNGVGRMTDTTGQTSFDLPFTDTNVSKFVAGIVLGALAALIALRALGFRFSFGVAAG